MVKKSLLQDKTIRIIRIILGSVSAYFIVVLLYGLIILNNAGIPNNVTDKVAEIPWQNTAYLETIGFIGLEEDDFVWAKNSNIIVIVEQKNKNKNVDEADFNDSGAIKTDFFITHTYEKNAFYDIFIFKSPKKTTRKYYFIVGDLLITAQTTSHYNEKPFEDFILTLNP